MNEEEDEIPEIDEVGYMCTYCGLRNTKMIEDTPNIAYCPECGMCYKVISPPNKKLNDKRS